MLKKPESIKLRGILLVCILLLTNIPLLIVGAISIFQTIDISNSHLQLNGSRLVEIGANIVDDQIMRYQAIVDKVIEESEFDVANDPELTSLQNNINMLSKTDQDIINIYFVGENREFIHALDFELDANVDLREVDWYDKSKNLGGQFSYDEPYLDEFTNEMTMTIYKAVIKNGHTYGVIGIDYSLANLSEQFSMLKYNDNAVINLTNTDGLMISCPDPAYIGTNLSEAAPLLLGEINKADFGNGRLVENGSEFEYLFGTCETTEWKLSLTIPTSILYSQVNFFIVKSVVVNLIAALVCIVMTWLLTGRITGYIETIIEFMKRAAAGEFNKQIQMSSYITEIQELEKYINMMQINVAKLIQNAEQSAVEVNAESNTLLAGSQEIASAVDQMNTTVSEISQGATHTASNLEKITLHIEDLSGNIYAIKEATEELNEVAHKTSELGQAGFKTVENVRTSSDQTKVSTSEVKEAIGEVVQKIEAISIMSATISQITSQTNLLALNAAIEAARAGEAGRGFSVVAEEISKLADETATSAKKIDEVVKNIEAFVKRAVDKVEETTASVESQEEIVNKAQVIFDEIIQAIDQFSGKAQMISGELVAVNRMKDEVLEEVSDLSSIMEETAAGTEESATHILMVKQSSEALVNSVSSLVERADDLKTNINQFQYK